MKMFNFCIALLFALSLCFMSLPGSSYAKSDETKTMAGKATEASKAIDKSTKSVKNAIEAVNVNTADKEMLTQIPGVGPVTADAIVKYREANGKFKSAKELLNIKGIGEKTLEKMTPFLKF